jgi:hypothetical protein
VIANTDIAVDVYKIIGGGAFCFDLGKYIPDAVCSDVDCIFAMQCQIFRNTMRGTAHAA